MPNIEVMELWLDKRKLDALEAVLQEHGSGVEQRMEEFFQTLYRETVPLPVQEEIQKQAQEEAARMAAETKDRVKLTACRITEGGLQNCFQTNTGSDILITAYQLNRYLSDQEAGDFEALLPERMPVSEETFGQLAMLRLNGAPEIVGVFDLDFDRGEFSCVDPEKGWSTFPMFSVCSALERTDKKHGLSHEQHLALLMKNLEAWAVPSPGHLPVSAISFEGEINAFPGRLSFLLDEGAWFDNLDAVFGTNTCTEDNNDFLTVRANYDPVRGEVCGELEVIVNREPAECSERLTYALNDVEQACVARKMEEYCQQQTGMGLAAYGGQIAPRPQPLTDTEAMALFAEQCVSEMAVQISERLQREGQQASEPKPMEYGAGPVMGGMQ